MQGSGVELDWDDFIAAGSDGSYAELDAIRDERTALEDRLAELAGALERVSGVPAPRRRIPLFALRVLGLGSEAVARLPRRLRHVKNKRRIRI